MKITFKNFRCYTDNTFTLPDTGLILLSGESGSGKSTLINGIYYALYGKVKKPYSFGTTSCKVTLEINNLTIIRSNKPNILKVIKENETFEDLIAQKVIDQTLMSHEEFTISSYIKQKSINCILNLSPLQQLSLIQSLTCNDTNLKDKIKIQLKNDLQELNKNKTKLEFSLNELSEKPEEVIFTENIDNLKKNLDERPELLNNYLHQQKDLDLVKVYQENLTELKTEKNILKEEREEIVHKANEKIEDPTLLRKKLDDILQNNYNKKVKRDQEIQIKKLKPKVLSKRDYENLLFQYNYVMNQENCKRLITDINSKLNLDLDYTQLIKHLKKLISDSQVKLLTCPSCDVSLKYTSKGKLKLTNKTCIDTCEISMDKLRRWVFSLESHSEPEELNVTSEELNNTIEEQKEYNMILDHLLSVEDIDLIEISETEEEVRQKLSEILTKNKEKEQNQDKLKNIDSKLFTITNKLDQLTKNINSISVNLTQTELKQKINELHEQIIIDKNNQKQMDLYFSYKQKLDQYEKWESKVNEYTDKNKILENNYKGSLSLKEMFRQAEVFSIESVIDSINYQTQYYLDKFFSDQLTAQLIVNKENKIEVKTQLNYKGNEYDSLNQLSGGEFDRVNLASVCGVNTQVGSNMLILDESLSSLDTENNTEILEFLRELSKEKLIIVCSHEAVAGIFDTIIKIE